MGGVSTVYTVVDSVLLEPLPFPDSDRLMRITQTDSNLPPFFVSVAEADFAYFREASSSFDRIAALRTTGTYIREGEGAFNLRQALVTPEWFPMLGIQPMLGRPLSAGDDAENVPAAVLGYEYWQTRFGGNIDVVGETIRLPLYTGEEDVAFNVVGVMPPDFNAAATGPDVRSPSLWTLLRPNDEPGAPRSLITVIGRLAPGVTPESAQAEIQALSRQLAIQYPDTHATRTTMVAPLKGEIIEDAGSALWVFLGAVGFVLLIGVANLTNLQIVRNAVRDHEIHTRAALGATRGRIIRQLVIEAGVLSLTGGGFGLALGWAGTRALVAANPAPFPRTVEIGLDLSIVLVTMGTAVLTGLVFGLLPAWQSSKASLQTTLRGNNRNATIDRRRTFVQRTVIALESATALVLLVGAGLLTHSFWLLYTEDAGMAEEGLWQAKLTLPPGYDSDAQADFLLRALEEIQAFPQVESAGTITSSPLQTGEVTLGGVSPESGGREAPPNGFSLSARSVSPGYFDAVGIRLVDGREFLESDTGQSELVVVLNESARQLLLGGGPALNERVRFLQTRTARIVGIVPDFKNARLDADVTPQLYTAATQALMSINSGAFMVRLRGDATSFAADLNRVITSLDPAASIEVETAGQARWGMFAGERFRTSVLLAFALTALFLAMVGIFGVVSYSVAQRNREIGIRVALGAVNRDVVGLLLRQAMWPAVLGLGIGLLSSFWITRLLTGFLFEIEPTDPVTFSTAVACLFLSSLTASLIPARRATRVDPMTALREE